MSNHSREPQTPLEMLAIEAEGLGAFSGFSLGHTKSSCAELLSKIGGSTIFHEYTVHDVSHINAMLDILDWVLPAATFRELTPADALMTTLAVYLHDLGMLVTEREYERRGATNFPHFRDQVLLAGEGAEDYQKKVEELGPEIAQRFYYQEFVRHHHAERIQEWISGDTAADLGDAKEVSEELKRLLGHLPEQFCDDLGVICRSHHLDDLDNLDKYRIRRAYGRTSAEFANLQYSAILLRSADLLHMTSDRTPSVTYRVTNPSDPISQSEWAKQMGVTQVCSKLAADDEGAVQEDLPRDTIEVHAHFTEAEPYFALTRFLKYVEGELDQCRRWALRAVDQGSKYGFPWTALDLDSIVTKGFLTKSFSFDLDQPKILGLLTGHTLYNDSGVVLRELVQNALDAVRVREFEETEEDGASAVAGRVDISWDSKDRILAISDNGTGMTQEMIENHFLTVGSSRYMSEQFKREHPGFSPISRFGIGVLTAFMVADRVDVYTCHKAEEQGRHLSLRNVLGRYLVRLLPKGRDAMQCLSPSGTRVELKLLPSAGIDDVEALAREWVVVPGVQTLLSIDGGTAIKIGYNSTKEWLREVVTQHPEMKGGAPGSSIEVRTSSIEGVDVAFAVRWSEHFKDWHFVTLSADPNRTRQTGRSVEASLGLSVHGIRVESGDFYFERAENPPVVVANVTGENAPRTTVARSGLAKSPSAERVMIEIYDALVRHVESEFDRLRDDGYSLTWAANEADFLLRPLLRGIPVDGRGFEESVRKAKLILVERDRNRNVASAEAIDSEEVVWISDCPLMDHAERLLRESPGTASLAELASLLGVGSPPDGLLICGGPMTRSALKGREIDRISLIRGERRVDYGWTKPGTGVRWRSMPHGTAAEIREWWTQRRREDWGATPLLSHRRAPFELAPRDLVVLGGEGYSGVSGPFGTLLFAGTPAADFVGSFYDVISMGLDAELAKSGHTVLEVLANYGGSLKGEMLEDWTKALRSLSLDGVQAEVALESMLSTYSPRAWERGRR